MASAIGAVVGIDPHQPGVGCVEEHPQRHFDVTQRVDVRLGVLGGGRWPIEIRPPERTVRLVVRGAAVEPLPRRRAERGEAVGLRHGPRAHLGLAAMHEREELRPRNTTGFFDLGRVGRRLTIDRRDHDRAQLVLDRAVVHHRAVPEVREHQHDIGRIETELVAQPPPRRLTQRLTRHGMTTTGIGPTSGHVGL